MPRKEINIADKVEYLSILDEKGTLDTDLEPEIPEEILLKLDGYKLMNFRALVKILETHVPQDKQSV